MAIRFDNYWEMLQSERNTIWYRRRVLVDENDAASGKIDSITDIHTHLTLQDSVKAVDSKRFSQIHSDPS